MQRGNPESGVSFVEVLVSLAVFSLAALGITGMLIDNSRINKAEQMRAEVQANARNTVSLIAQRIRTAGWDPLALGFESVVLDDELTDSESFIELYSDLDGDGTLDGLGESVRIRHVGQAVEWRLQPTGPYVSLATGISNDADGDETTEPMFVGDTAVPPEWIRIRATAESPVVDPRTGLVYRYTIETEVALRGNL